MEVKLIHLAYQINDNNDHSCKGQLKTFSGNNILTTNCQFTHKHYLFDHC